MRIKNHDSQHGKIAEVFSDSPLFGNSEQALDLLGDLYYQGYDHIMLHVENIHPDFFELRNGLAGEILQKFANYRMNLAIVGDLSPYTSKSLKDFVYESNQNRLINFMPTTTEALTKWDT